MKTHCNQKTFEFQTENSREIVAHFNGGIVANASAESIERRIRYVQEHNGDG